MPAPSTRYLGISAGEWSRAAVPHLVTSSQWHLLPLCVCSQKWDSRFAYLAEAAALAKGWHFPPAPKILRAKPQQSRKLQAKGMKHSCHFGYLEAPFSEGSLSPARAGWVGSPSQRNNGRERCLQGQGDMVESSLSVHRDLPHKAGRTPTSQLPHKQPADARTSLCPDLTQEPASSERIPCSQPQEPEAGMLHTHVPGDRTYSNR